MKSIFILFFLLFLTSTVYARDFTVTIPDNALNNFATDYLIARPIPKDENGVALYTTVQWIRLNILDLLNDTRYQGVLIKYNINNSNLRPSKVNEAI